MVAAANVPRATERCNGRLTITGAEEEDTSRGMVDVGVVMVGARVVVGNNESEGGFVGDVVRGVVSQGSRMYNRSTLLQFRTMAEKSPEFRRVRPANLRNVGPVFSSSHCKQLAK
jgi:hypothetical protein